MEVPLTSVYVADGIGAILTAIILAGNAWRIQDRKTENVCLMLLLVMTLLNCIVDPCVFTCDGYPGKVASFLNYAGNL